MIRHATLADIPAMLEIGKRFADDAGVTANVGWNDDSVASLLTALIENENGLLLTGDGVILGGVAYAHPFNNATVIFQEMFWRSEGRGGVKALRMAEDWMRSQGVTRSIMVGLDSMPELVSLYGRLGYKPCERSFCKDLS
jgi:hypothetical protein